MKVVKIQFMLVFSFKSAGDPWMGPEFWNTVKPSIHLNLDDATPFILHGGATMVITPVR